MRESVVRVRIPYELMKRFKHICIELELSLPKQTASIITNFVSIHEENKKRIEESKLKLDEIEKNRKDRKP